MQNDDGSIHPATVQADILEQLTPATVAVWLRRQAAQRATSRIAAVVWPVVAQQLAIAATVVEKLIDQ